MLDDAGLVQEVRSSVSKNYAGVKFTDTETPVVYYNQSDSRWANKDYAGKSISESRMWPYISSYRCVNINWKIV